MERAILGHVEVATSGAAASWEQKPYRAPRLGSGVPCSAPISETDGSGRVALCESPLTTRLRGGKDNLSRPMAEYLCETCGTVFVALTVSLDPRVRFDEVNVPDDDMRDHPTPSIATALRRTERLPKTTIRAKMALLEICPECGNIVHTDNGEWEAHQRAHLED